MASTPPLMSKMTRPVSVSIKLRIAIDLLLGQADQSL